MQDLFHLEHGNDDVGRAVEPRRDHGGFGRWENSKQGGVQVCQVSSIKHQCTNSYLCSGDSKHDCPDSANTPQHEGKRNKGKVWLSQPGHPSHSLPAYGGPTTNSTSLVAPTRASLESVLVPNKGAGGLFWPLRRQGRAHLSLTSSCPFVDH
ncbi:hypothetical protein CLAIMM_03398 isoform 1, partial [Cladophialophora immunda]